MKPPKVRFSLRKLLILVALFSTALAVWPLLEKGAKDDVAELALGRTRDEFKAATGKYTSKQDAGEVALPTTVAPYVVRVVFPDKGEMDLANGVFAKTYKYYVWLFGIKLRLPIETEINST